MGKGTNFQRCCLKQRRHGNRLNSLVSSALPLCILSFVPLFRQAGKLLQSRTNIVPKLTSPEIKAGEKWGRYPGADKSKTNPHLMLMKQP